MAKLTINNKRLHIAKGNDKIGKNGITYVWSLPAFKTCTNSTTMCRYFCYAKASELLYKEVLPCRERNYIESLKDSFVDDMINLIQCKLKYAKVKMQYFRIHEGGDFYSLAYFDKWMQIVRAFPQVKFLAFTKSTFVKERIHELPANLNLFYSVWADTTPSDIIHELPLSIAGDCDHLIPAKDSFECTGKCAECYHCFNKRTNVHFKIHGIKAQQKGRK
jgi:hypothetical protein